VDEARYEVNSDLAEISRSMIKRLEQNLPIADIYGRFTSGSQCNDFCQETSVIATFRG
jgi:hypothetical protein